MPLKVVYQHSTNAATTKLLPAKRNNFARDDEILEIPPETDIIFSNDPVIQDFLNLSSVGSRGTKTAQKKKRVSSNFMGQHYQ